MLYRIFQVTIAALLIVGIPGCAPTEDKTANETPAVQVSLSEIPTPARTEIENLTAGGQIKKIEKEEVEGKVIYDIEATINDKDVEYDIAADGTVLSSEESIAYDLLPADVKAAVEKYFGSAQGLKAHREIEKGQTFYEVEGSKDGSAIELKLAETGEIIEEE